MKRWLSRPRNQMRAEYDVVVVGSGYGGSVAALRFAQATRSGGERMRVCLLERGREILPGDYPETPWSAARESQLHLPFATLNPSGMFDYHVCGELNLLVGCGLGGGSLINAGVCIFPDKRVFEEEGGWPSEIQGKPETLKEYYQRALSMLRPERLPESISLNKKNVLFKTLKGAAGGDEKLQQRAYVCVHYEGVEDAPPGPVPMKECTYCGNCVTGCNYSAKKTLLMNYLPAARQAGAEIYSDVRVRRVARRDDGEWRVYYRHVGDGRESFPDAPDSFLVADRVVLSAGTIGTTEILLRSRENGLALSDRLGQRFSGNGDVWAFAYNGQDPVNGVGWRGSNALTEPVGPTIVAVVDLREKNLSLPRENGVLPLKDGIVVEDGSIPSALAGILPYALWAASWQGKQEAANTLQRALQAQRSAVSLLCLGKGAYVGADRNTLVYLVMAHDDLDPDRQGAIDFRNDRAEIAWPRYAQERIFARVSETLQKATKEVAGVYVPDPLTGFTRSDLISVHPLGGCPMGDSAGDGVVDDCGRVFKQGDERYDGLYVMDGSFIPRSLGTNPLLTITALAERACSKLIAEDPKLRTDADEAFARLTVKYDREGWSIAEKEGAKP